MNWPRSRTRRLVVSPAAVDGSVDRSADRFGSYWSMLVHDQALESSIAKEREKATRGVRQRGPEKRRAHNASKGRPAKRAAVATDEDESDAGAVAEDESDEAPDAAVDAGAAAGDAAEADERRSKRSIRLWYSKLYFSSHMQA